MTEQRLFVGRKTCEDRFTIIEDYNDEIGVKENRSGDVIVLKHNDLNAQQFVAQLVVFLNDQNQAIVDLFDGNKYWSGKASEKIKELEEENERLKQQLSEQGTQIDFLKDENIHMKQILNENKQLKQQLAIIDRLIDNKIDEFKNGDYGDLPSNTIHMFLDLKQEIGGLDD